jgi:hypothetical protein
MLSTYAMSQDTTFVFRPASNLDSLTVGIVYEEDERTAGLLRELKTYEIQGDVERKLAEEQRMKFIRLFPAFESFIEYDAPNYTVKVGSFRSIEEAEEFRKMITPDFPMSIIQKAKIKMSLDKGDK